MRRNCSSEPVSSRMPSLDTLRQKPIIVSMFLQIFPRSLYRRLLIVKLAPLDSLMK